MNYPTYSVNTQARFLLKGDESKVISSVFRYKADDLNGWYAPYKVIIRGPKKTYVFEPKQKIKLPKGKKNADFK
jgi:hypothetical protein